MPKCDGMLNIVYKSYKAIILDVVHILIIGKHIAYVHKFQINLIFSIIFILPLYIYTDFI
jgi:hypothetical protein